MKRASETTDAEWDEAMKQRKRLAEERMARSDNPPPFKIAAAARAWYGKDDRDAQCLAENRLMRGERPEAAE